MWALISFLLQDTTGIVFAAGMSVQDQPLLLSTMNNQKERAKKEERRENVYTSDPLAMRLPLFI